MGDFTADPALAAEIEEGVREYIDWVLRGQAQVAEFTAGTMFERGQAIDRTGREVAVALNVLAELT